MSDFAALEGAVIILLPIVLGAVLGLIIAVAVYELVVHNEW